MGPKSQAGLSAIIAVFVLVIMSLLAAAMLRLAQSDSQATATETLSLRAEMAARSAGEWALNRLFLTAAEFDVADLNKLDPGCDDVGLPNGSAQWGQEFMRQCRIERLECAERPQSPDAFGETALVGNTETDSATLGLYRHYSIFSVAACGDERFEARRMVHLEARRPTLLAASTVSAPPPDCNAGTKDNDGKFAGNEGEYCGCDEDDPGSVDPAVRIITDKSPLLCGPSPSLNRFEWVLHPSGDPDKCKCVAPP